MFFLEIIKEITSEIDAVGLCSRIAVNAGILLNTDSVTLYTVETRVTGHGVRLCNGGGGTGTSGS